MSMPRQTPGRISADNRMTVPILLLFLTDLSMTQDSRPDLNKTHVRAMEGFEPLEISNESATLSEVDDSDSFCKGNVNVVFSDPSEANIYYRCRRNRRETWKCKGDLRFDRITRKCSERLLGSEALDACHQQEDGLYPVYDTRCKHYIRCKAGITVDEKKCLENELFDYRLQSCRNSAEVVCTSLLCTPTNDDFFVVPGSKCQAYYFCRKGRRFDFLCPKGQIFNVQAKNCVDGGICYEPICTGRINGVYADTTHECNRYFQCTGGELREVMSCPKDFKHNGFGCVSSFNVKCEKPEKTAIAIYNRKYDECKLLEDGNHIIAGTGCNEIRTCENGKTVGTLQCPINFRFRGNQCFRKELVECDLSCSGNPDGYYPDQMTNCQSYYLCINGKLKDRKKCQNGFSFDGKMCLPSNMISCNKRKTDDSFCVGLKDGFHPDYQNGCRNYYYCRNQKIIIISSCPVDMKWNGTACVGKDEFQCEIMRPLKRCQGIAKGLYQDLFTNCTNYVYCNNGEGTILSCRNGDIYDGYKCRNATEYTCPNMIRDECYNQPDGYRQDEESNCRSYYFCSNGSKITYICDNDFVFNGTHCVSPKLYKCPYSANDCDGKYNGYYPDETTGCKRYYYCLQGKRITTLSCGGKKIFTGEACALLNDAKTACAKFSSNPCRRRKDGKYPHRTFPCEKYIQCRNEMLVEESFCPEGTSFDGTNCSVHSSCFSQRRKRPCDGSKIGFVPDYFSGCKNYYFCIGNITKMASCPDGTIFNGQVCQDSNTYKCPSQTNLYPLDPLSSYN